MISQTLRDASFIVIKKEYKKPEIEKEIDWNTKIISYEEANKKLEEGFNIGLVANNDFIIFDCDTLELALACEQLLPETYSEITCSNGFHYFYRIKGTFENLQIKKGKIHYGELRCNRQYVVIAPSIAYNKANILMPYVIQKETPIPYITKEQIQEVLKKFIEFKEKKEISESAIELLKKYNLDKTDRWLFDMIEKEILVKEDTGGNSIVFKNAAIILVREQIPEEERRVIGKTLANLCEKRTLPMLYGWIKKAENNELAKVNEREINNFIETNEYPLSIYERETRENWEIKLSFILDSDLKNIQIQQIDWLVSEIIPEKSVCFLGGKRGTFKSFIGLVLAYTLASNKNFLEVWETKKDSKVLYLDEENGLSLIKERADKIKKGLEISKDVNVAFLSFANLKLDRQEWVRELEKFISTFQPNLIIVDSLRRFVSFEENDAGEVSKLFTDIIRPLSQKYNLSWLLLHHMRKGISGRNPTDEMDELRGSSDLTNYADIVLFLQRNRGSIDSFILKQAKCRFKQEIPAKAVRIDWGEDSLKMTCLGDAQETIYADEICAKLVLNWMAEEELTTFKTKEVKEALKSEKQTIPTIERALKLLVEQGKLTKPQRGIYELDADLKLDDFKPSNHQNPQDGKDSKDVKKFKKNKPSEPSNYNRVEGSMVKIK